MSLLLRGNTSVSFIILFFTNNVNCCLYVLGLYISIRGFKRGYKRVGRGGGLISEGAYDWNTKSAYSKQGIAVLLVFLLSFIIS